MIRKTVKRFTQKSKGGLFTEIMERETYWLFFVIPIYIRENIIKDNR